MNTFEEWDSIGWNNGIAEIVSYYLVLYCYWMFNLIWNGEKFDDRDNSWYSAKTNRITAAFGYVGNVKWNELLFITSFKLKV